MKRFGRALLWLMLFAPLFASAQIDPVKRDLIQLGYNQPRLKATRRWPATPFIITTSRIFCARTSRCGWRSRRCIWIPNLASSAAWDRTRISPSAWPAADLPTVTTKSAAAHIIPANRLTATAGKFPRAFIICSIPADEIPLNFVLRGTAHYSFYRPPTTAPRPIFRLPDDHGDFQRAHRPALGRR